MVAQQLNIDNIANNLANVNTTAFKRDVASFQSRAAESMTAPGGFRYRRPLLDRLGGGTFVSPTRTEFAEGEIVRHVKNKRLYRIEDQRTDDHPAFKGEPGYGVYERRSGKDHGPYRLFPESILQGRTTGKQAAEKVAAEKETKPPAAGEVLSGVSTKVEDRPKPLAAEAQKPPAAPKPKPESKPPPKVEEKAKKMAPEPGARLPDTRGRGVFFHGTSEPIIRLEEGAYASLNWFGQGFYTTDSLNVAKGYTKKGRGGAPNTER